MSLKKLAAGVALTTLAALAATGAYAQSTATQSVEELVVTAGRPAPLGGLVQNQVAPKTRDVVTSEYIQEQTAGANGMQVLNLVPGVNFTQDDPFGFAGSAGHISIRGLKGANIAEMEDGMPLNDAGNYAVYAGERLDPEVLDSVNVITGSAEVDAPSASSLGGTINYNSITPSKTFGGMANASGGSFGYYRTQALIQTGEIGPWGTRAFVEGSYATDNKFTTGFGRDWKWQVNGKVYQDLHHEGDFVSVAAFYDRQVFSNYDGVDFASGGATTTTGKYPVTTAGYNFHGLLNTPWNSDYNQYYASPSTNANNQYFQGLQINPTYTGNLRGAFRYTLIPDKLKVTIDPSYQWVLATGGTYSHTTSYPPAVLAGTDPRLAGVGQTQNHSNYGACTNAAGAITGLSLDGATSGGSPVCTDQVRLINPSITQTQRYTVNSSLIFTPLPDQLLQVSYSYDHGYIRQTGDFGTIQANGWPTSVFAGLQGWGTPILTSNGQPFESRNRLTLATLNQVSAEYIGKFFDDHLRVDLGARDPFLSRDLNQYCYTQAPQNVYCNATAAQATTAGYTVAPFHITKSYSKALPNVGFTWNFDRTNSVFVDYTEALNAPVNDDLYAVSVLGLNGSTSSQPGTDPVQPETSRTFEGGYRYQTSRFKATIDGYYIEDNNHILSTYNLETGNTTDTNVGAIHFYGFEGQVGWIPIEHLTLTGSVSYEHSQVINNIPYSATYTIQAAGKQFYDTPQWMLGGTADYDWQMFKVGGTVKYVDARQVTALNDLQVPSYVTLDLHLRANLDFVHPGTYFQLNVNNLFDERYIGSINYATSNNPNNLAFSQSFADQGSPRTVQGTIRFTF